MPCVIVKSRHPYRYDDEIRCNTLNAMMRIVASDVIHYHSAPWIHRILAGRIRYLDYSIARTLRKKVVWHFHGHEVRGQRVEKGPPQFDCPAIVSTPDLLRYLPNATWIPNAADPELFYPRKTPHPKTIVGCYDSPNPYVKHYSPVAETLAAVRELQRNGKGIDVRILSGYKHQEVPEYFQQIDIWVDKFGMDFYGLCALEASLCEIPVVTQIGEPEQSLIPSCPFITTERCEIKRTIEYLLDEDVRKELGKKGAEFTKRFHDPVGAADKCLKLYRSQMRDPGLIGLRLD